MDEEESEGHFNNLQKPVLQLSKQLARRNIQTDITAGENRTR
jgi:hypothetical protein